jgi:hypothetical protein
MTRKSPSQRDSVLGQRPALDPDADTVAIPRMDDEFTDNNENDTSKDVEKDKPRR